MRELTLRPEAQLDVHDAASWYENQRLGLGMRFLDELDDVVNASALIHFSSQKFIPESGAAC